ncbi:hypothetical protein RCU94_14485, partial [Escherichia coli]|nr:hypothetical protein [Escherichia coli]
IVAWGAAASAGRAAFTPAHAGAERARGAQGGAPFACPPRPAALQGSPPNFSDCPAMITLPACVSVSGCASC